MQTTIAISELTPHTHLTESQMITIIIRASPDDNVVFRTEQKCYILEVFKHIGFSNNTTLKEFKEMVSIHDFAQGSKIVDRCAYIGVAGWDTVGLVRFDGYFRKEAKTILTSSMLKECKTYLAGERETPLEHRQKFSIGWA